MRKFLVALIVAVATTSAYDLGYDRGAEKGANRLSETLLTAGQGVVASDDNKTLVACFRVH